MHERIILGIDPGTSVMGYGIIKESKNSIEFLAMDILSLKKIDGHELKLKEIFSTCSSIIENYLPDELAIEAPFYGKNVQSMLKLGRAQGVAMAAALNRSVPIFEYSPRKIKQSITGNGNASKEQVAGMLQSILQIKELPAQLDATDGLAAAVCHYFQKGSTTLPKYKSWNAFLKSNPGRLK